VKGKEISGYKDFWKGTQNIGEGQDWEILYSHDASRDLSKELLFGQKKDNAVKGLKPTFAVFEYALVISRKGKIDTEFSKASRKVKVFCGHTENAQAYFNSREWVDENYGYIKPALEGKETREGKKANLECRNRALMRFSGVPSKEVFDGRPLFRRPVRVSPSNTEPFLKEAHRLRVRTL
jgi:hypothetical protein